MSITLSLNHVGHPSHPSHRWPKVGTVGTNTLQETKLCSSTRAPPTILSWVGVFGVSRVVGAVENSVKHWDQTARDSMRYEKRAKWADKWVQMYIQDISRYIKIYQDIIEVWNSIDFNCDNSTCDSVHDTQSLWPGTSSDPFAVQFLDVIVTSDEKRNDGASSSWV